MRKMSTQQKLDEIYSQQNLNYHQKKGTQQSKINLDDIDTKSEQSAGDNTDNYSQELFEDSKSVDEKGDYQIQEQAFDESSKGTEAVNSRNISKMSGYSSTVNKRLVKLAKLAKYSEKKVLKDFQVFSSKSFKNYVNERALLGYKKDKQK